MASKDPVENLSTLALFISSDVRFALAASFTTFVARAWFHQYTPEEGRRWFHTHPANNIIYWGLEALEERSIVKIYETLKDDNKLFPIEAEIRRKADLRLHRLKLSHPTKLRWQDKKMQEFADADRDAYDLRAALVWDLQRSINEELAVNGRELHNDALPVRYDMAVSLNVILSLSCHANVAAPTPQHLFEYMQRSVGKYQDWLEAHPDGNRDLEAEKARAERRQERSRRRREKWAAQVSGDDGGPSDPDLGAWGIVSP